MKRTQLYLEDDAWKALHIRARQLGTSISNLVRQAVREKFLSSTANRREAMEAVVGIWKDRDDLPDTETYMRQIRKDTRFKRMAAADATAGSAPKRKLRAAKDGAPRRSRQAGH